MYSSFLYADVYWQVESIINNHLIRNKVLLVLEVEHIKEIEKIIQKSFWYKYNKKDFDLRTFLKDIMILDTEDKIVLKDNLLLIKKKMPYTEERQKFRKVLSFIKISTMVEKFYSQCLPKYVYNIELFLDYFKEQLKEFDINERTFMLLKNYYLITIFEEVILICHHKKTIQSIKFNSIIISSTTIGYLAKSILEIENIRKKNTENIIHYIDIEDKINKLIIEMEEQKKQVTNLQKKKNSILNDYFRVTNKVDLILKQHLNTHNTLVMDKTSKKYQLLKEYEREELDLKREIETLDNTLTHYKISLETKEKEKIKLKSEFHHLNTLIKNNTFKINYYKQLLNNRLIN